MQMTTVGQLQCWRCGALCEEDLRVLPRTAQCNSCHADLHVCRQCEFYDTGVAKHCRETIADEVQDKTRANFCAYLKLRINAFEGASDKTSAARQQLDALFGATSSAGAPNSADAAKSALEALFGIDKK